MNSNQLKWGALLSYVQMALSLLIGLIYTPVMLRLLGQSEYGLYNTVSSTISTLSILNLGFGASYIRYYAQYKKEQQDEKIRKLNGLFLMIFSVIGAIALVCGLILTFHLEYVFDTGLTRAEYETAQVLMLLLTGNLAISFPMSVFSSIISAHERYIVLKIIGLIRTVVSPLVTLPLLLMGYRSIAVVAVTVALSFFADLINLYYVIFVLKCRISFARPEKGLFRDMLVYTSFIALNMIVDQINWNVDKILLARFKGTIFVSIYAIGYTLFSYYDSFSKAISGVFTPRIHRIVNETRHDMTFQRRELTDIFVRVGRIQFLILGLIASGIVFFGKPFIVSWWAGKGYEDSYYVALLLILPASIALIQNLGIEIQRAENRHQFRSIVYLVMAAVNLILSIILCQKYGAVGCAIGTAVSLIVANGLIMNWYYHKKCNIDILCFWKNILRMSLGMILPIIIGLLINKFFDLSHPVIFVVAVGGYTLAYCISMWFIGMNDYEKSLISSPILKLRERICNDKHHR